MAGGFNQSPMHEDAGISDNSERPDGLVARKAKTLQKTFVFDLDGTIAFDGKPVAWDVEHALTGVLMRGHRVVFATARAPRGLRSAFRRPTLWSQSAVFCNGAFFIMDGHRVFSQPLPEAPLRRLLHELDQNRIVYVLEGGHTYYHGEHENDFLATLKREAPTEQLSLRHDDLLANAYKLSILSPCGYIGSHSSWEDFDVVRHVNGHTDIVARGVDKWLCLAHAMEGSSWDDWIVYGNDSNDLGLFKNIKHSVLVGSHEELHKYAEERIVGDTSAEIEMQLIRSILRYLQ